MCERKICGKGASESFLIIAQAIDKELKIFPFYLNSHITWHSWHSAKLELKRK